MKKPTPEDVQKFREQHECGVFEARARLMKEYVRGELDEIKRANEPAGAKVTRLIDLMLYALEEGPVG